MARSVLTVAIMTTTGTRCSRCDGTHCRCTGCGNAYPRTAAPCVATACRGAAMVCRCGAMVTWETGEARVAAHTTA